jgi:hypothetical protein
VYIMCTYIIYRLQAYIYYYFLVAVTIQTGGIFRRQYERVTIAKIEENNFSDQKL